MMLKPFYHMLRKKPALERWVSHRWRWDHWSMWDYDVERREFDIQLMSDIAYYLTWREYIHQLLYGTQGIDPITGRKYQRPDLRYLPVKSRWRN